MAKKKAQRNKRASDKFKAKHNVSRSEFAATKIKAKLVKKQAKNVKRGRVGNNVKPRKVLKD